jgi:tRNA-2-methylthio-N6-dimethylallyladenosine synthase
MNYSDAERIASVFNSHGFSLTSNESEADIIIAFACSVREKAVHKVLGKANQWAKWKNPKSQAPNPKQIPNSKSQIQKNNPTLILTGCILEQDRKKLEEKFDLVFSINEIEKLEEFLNSIKYKVLSIKREPKNHNTKYIIHNTEKDLEKENNYLALNPVYQSSYSANVPIMTGCDNFCSYCAVPYTRGRETSRSEEDILKEVRDLVKNGYKEITLLGQNVNSYKSIKYKVLSIKQEKENHNTEYLIHNTRIDSEFVSLLKKIDLLDGNHWLRFYANHPKDFNDELINFLKNSKHFCHYIHLPLQSGDNEILKKMNRHYTAEQYLKIIKKIRAEIPDCTITTDIIVGFPGESEKQFQNTVKLLEKVGFDMIFISEYSARSGTPASKLEDDISHEEKNRRKKFLNDEVLAKSVKKNNQKLVGEKVRVLIYKNDKNGDMVGKTAGLKDVRIAVSGGKTSPLQIGSFVEVKITKASSWGLEGNPYK